MKLQFSSKNAPPQEPPKPDIVLASQSTGRRMLLEKLGVRFRVVVARIDEDAIIDPNPDVMVKKRALAKAKEVITHPRVYSIPEEREVLVIAADSMAAIGRKVYGKSQDREDTKAMLKALMGKTHTFITALHITLLQGPTVKKTWEKLIKTKVTMRKMTPAEVESYVGRFDFTRFAGGYAINEAPWDIVMKIDGSYTNVIGLPFEVLLPILRNLKIIL